MPKKKTIKAVRLSPQQEQLLVQLSKKLGVDTTNVIRIAIHRLAESEGIIRGQIGNTGEE